MVDVLIPRMDDCDSDFALDSDENMMMCVMAANSLKPSYSSLSIATATMASMSNSVSMQSIGGGGQRCALGDIGNTLPVGLHTFGQAHKNESVKNAATVPSDCRDMRDSYSMQELAEKLEVSPSESNDVAMEAAPTSLEASASLMLEETMPDACETSHHHADRSQLFPDYDSEIGKYLSFVEKKYKIKPSFLKKRRVTPEMRSMLINWLYDVHATFELIEETLFLCVQIIDLYLQVHNIPKEKLQLLGISALYLASKYEDVNVPYIEEFADVTDDSFTCAQIRRMEIAILKTLKFTLGKPSPLYYLQKFTKAAQVTTKQEMLAKYFMELSLLDAEFASYKPSLLAACSLCLSLKLLKTVKAEQTLEACSEYKRGKLNTGMKKLCQLIVKSTNNGELDSSSIALKYKDDEREKVSLIEELGSSLVKKLAGVTSSSA